MKGSCGLHAVKQYAEKLEQAAGVDKNVENTVGVALFLANQVENRADGKGNAARKNPQKTGKGHGGDRDFTTQNNCPAHYQVAYKGEGTVPFQIDGIQGHGQTGTSPFDAEDCPGKRGIQRANRAECYRRIGPGNQKINIAMVDDTHNLFSGVFVKTVVNGRNAEHNDHGSAVYGGRNNCPRVVI